MTTWPGTFWEEARKLPAFFRRNFLTTFSYRLAFFADWFNLAIQLVVFSFVGRLVDPTRLPEFGGRRVSYVEFVAVGIALMSFVQIGLSRVMGAIRNEQLIGTLESLLVSPTAPTTLQLGLVIYDFFYVPLRTAIFLFLAAVIFDIQIQLSGTAPALLMLLSFIPFVWGLGVASAAGTLTFRRGTGLVGVGVAALTVLSAAYIPLEVLPGWARTIARYNPFTLALTGTRRVLLGGSGWAEVWSVVRVFMPLSAVTLALGVLAFRWALRRERKLGTLGLY